MRKDIILKCPNCKLEKEIKEFRNDCYDCNSSSALFYIEYKIKNKEFPLLKYNLPLLRYSPLLPLEAKEILDPIIGNTPLIHAKNLGKYFELKNLYIKDETRNPSGSFKDREAVIGISMAKTLKYNHVIVASSGNLASAIARACAFSNMTCIAFVPEDTPEEKIVMIASYGAKVIKVRGTYDDCRTIIMKISKECNIPSASWELRPFILEGWKTTIMEILDQMNFSIPDVIIIPAGGGGHILGIYKALKELHSIGKIDHLPKIIGVQASGCSPYVKAFNNDLEEVAREENPRKIAKSIRVSNPFEGKYVLKAIKEINGSFIDVSDDKIFNAVILLGKTEGVFAEPAGAASIAGLKKIIKESKIEHNEKIVVIATGSGLKDVTDVKHIYRSFHLISRDINIKEVFRLF